LIKIVLSALDILKP